MTAEADSGPAASEFDVLHAIDPPVEFHFEGHTLRSECVVGEQYEGPAGSVHGGICALLLDHALGLVSHHFYRQGFTATLTVNYLRPTPLGVPLQIRANHLRVEGRKSYAEGEILHDGAVCVRAEGLFVAPRVNASEPAGHSPPPDQRRS